MTTTYPVTRRQRAAARLRRALDQAEGKQTDPRVDAIAEAKSVNALAVRARSTASATVERQISDLVTVEADAEPVVEEDQKRESGAEGGIRHPRSAF